MNAIAFVLDGLYYGLSDFGYASYSMVPCSFYPISRSLNFHSSQVNSRASNLQLVIGLVTSAFFLLAVPKFGLAGVWTGLFLFMTLRVLAGIWRYVGSIFDTLQDLNFTFLGP